MKASPIVLQLPKEQPEVAVIILLYSLEKPRAAFEKTLEGKHLRKLSRSQDQF